MPLKFSANLTMMFTEVDDRIARIGEAAEAGFGACEYIFIYDLPVDDIRREMDRTGLEMSVINIAVGEGVQMGDLVAAVPGKEDKFRENVDAAVKYCAALRPTAMVIPAYRPPEGISREVAVETFKKNVPYAADALGEIGIPVLIEALSPKLRPNSILTTTAEVMEVLEEVNHPNLGIEYDAFHMYQTEDDMAGVVEKHLDLIGNIQIADVPGRGEPGTGEIDYPAFLGALDRMGYDKWVALEYEPTGSTLDSLAWMAPWKNAA